MRDKKSQKFPGAFTYQLFVSDAFRNLRPSSKEILLLMYFEVKTTSQKKRGKYTPLMANRHDIKMPYAEIRDRLKYGDKAIHGSFKELLAHGFIEIIKHGGSVKGDVNVYGIAEDWRKWEPGDVVREIKKNGKAGWQRKKISSPVGKSHHSPVGKSQEPKNGCDYPRGKTLLTEKCGSQRLG